MVLSLICANGAEARHGQRDVLQSRSALIGGGLCASQSCAVAAPLGRRWCVETSPFSGFTQGMREEAWVCRGPMPCPPAGSCWAHLTSPLQERGGATPASGHPARAVQA